MSSSTTPPKGPDSGYRTPAGVPGHLFTSVQYQDVETYDSAWPGIWGEEGWWIDDVTIDYTLGTPTVLTSDDKDNRALALDADSDCVGDNVDCDATSNQVWALPGEATDLSLTHSGGETGTTVLTWTEPANLGGAAVDYTVLVTGPTSCTESSGISGTSTIDSDTPAAGTVHRLLVRASNTCGGGSWGRNSSEVPRSGCP